MGSVKLREKNKNGNHSAFCIEHTALTTDSAFRVPHSAFTAEPSDAGLRLDVYLAEELDKTRSNTDKLIRAGAVSVNGASVKSGYSVKLGDRIEITFPEETTDLVPENIPLDILFEDEAVAVLSKPQGMTVHPGGGCYTGTLVNALLYRYPALSEQAGSGRPGIVHRLDKDTSGVMVIAKTAAAHLSLSAQFAGRTVSKAYLAILEGNLKSDSGELKTLIARDPKNRKLMCVSKRDGREAVTRYRVLERFDEHCLVEFKILTGRTHQIRVHAKHLGHPVVGDPQYGYKKQKFKLSGQLLHAQSLSFRHPLLGEELAFTAAPPPEFERVLGVLRENSLLTTGRDSV